MENVEMMYPDITTIVYGRTGLETRFFNLLVAENPIGYGNDWDVFCVLYTKDDDDPSIPKYVAVSLAVKGSKADVSRKLLIGSVVNVSGTFGEIENSSSGSETFRRVFCDIKDINFVRRVE